MASRSTTRAVAAAASATLRVAIYIRRSTDEEHQPFSLEAQDRKLRAYIKSQPNWSLVATFPDGSSGSSLQRDGLQKALAAFVRGAGAVPSISFEFDRRGGRGATWPADPPDGRCATRAAESRQ
jgi:hypothetical protein